MLTYNPNPDPGKKCFRRGGGGGGGVQGRVQLSCGHVDNERMEIHDDNLYQGYFFWGVGWGEGLKWGQERRTRQEEEQ